MVYVLVHHIVWIMNIAVLFFYSVSDVANCFYSFPSLRCNVLLVFLPFSPYLNSGLELRQDELEESYGMRRQMCNVFVQSFNKICCYKTFPIQYET